MSRGSLTDEASTTIVSSARRPWWLSIKGLVYLWSAAILLAVIVLFVADNFVLVEVRLMQLRVQARLAWVVILAFIAGSVAGVTIGRITAGRGFWRQRRGTND